MSRNKTLNSKFKSIEEVSGIALAQHMGVSRNRISAIATRFGLIKVGKGFRKLDVFRKIHGVEPMLLQATLATLKTKYSENITSGENAEPEMLCLIEELEGITDLAETLWDQGLVHLTDLAAEYGYAYDTFRKKLKAGSINLPPARPIELSDNRVMYRPLDVVMWHRHGIALDLPRAVVTSPREDGSSPPGARTSFPTIDATPESMTEAVFTTAIAATDEKSGFCASSAPSADALHEPRL
ncbi:MAG: hypothetical protein EP320_10555 [Rhodobacteraceae bacterium]|nr:MAG: hypothetical protein EP320_10555 [Paracoccaceae bacterium]